MKRRYGVCFSDGEIRIRLRHVRTGEPLKYSSLVNTLCHELAHLRHFHHGETFKRFYLELLAYARAEGIYRPDPPGRRAAAEPRPRRLRRVGPVARAPARSRTGRSSSACSAEARRSVLERGWRVRGEPRRDQPFFC